MKKLYFKLKNPFSTSVFFSNDEIMTCPLCNSASSVTLSGSAFYSPDAYFVTQKCLGRIRFRHLTDNIIELKRRRYFTAPSAKGRYHIFGQKPGVAAGNIHVDLRILEQIIYSSDTPSARRCS